MQSLFDFLYAPAVVFIGYVVLGVTGFGSALVIVPLLSWTLPLPHVVVLVLLLDVPASAVMSWLNRNEADRTEFLGLLPGIAMGGVAGLWLQGTLEPRWPLLALGVYVTGVGTRELLSFDRERPRPVGAWRIGAGFGAGLVEVMFATSGPILVAWLLRRLSEARILRATIPPALLVCCVTALMLIGAQGRLSDSVLWLQWALLFGVALTGALLGHRLAPHVPTAALKRIICMMIVFSGVALTLRAA